MAAQGGRRAKPRKGECDRQGTAARQAQDECHADPLHLPIDGTIRATNPERLTRMEILLKCTQDVRSGAVGVFAMSQLILV